MIYKCERKGQTDCTVRSGYTLRMCIRDIQVREGPVGPAPLGKINIATRLNQRYI